MSRVGDTHRRVVVPADEKAAACGVCGDKKAAALENETTRNRDEIGGMIIPPKGDDRRGSEFKLTWRVLWGHQESARSPWPNLSRSWSTL